MTKMGWRGTVAAVGTGLGFLAGAWVAVGCVFVGLDYSIKPTLAGNVAHLTVDLCLRLLVMAIWTACGLLAAGLVIGVAEAARRLMRCCRASS